MNLTQNLILLFSRFGNSLKLSQLPSLGTHIITLNKAKDSSCHLFPLYSWVQTELKPCLVGNFLFKTIPFKMQYVACSVSKPNNAKLWEDQKGHFLVKFVLKILAHWLHLYVCILTENKAIN